MTPVNFKLAAQAALFVELFAFKYFYSFMRNSRYNTPSLVKLPPLHRR